MFLQKDILRQVWNYSNHAIKKSRHFSNDLDVHEQVNQRLKYSPCSCKLVAERVSRAENNPVSIDTTDRLIFSEEGKLVHHYVDRESLVTFCHRRKQ